MPYNACVNWRKHLTNQSGLAGILEIGLVLVVLVVIGLAGYRVYQAQHKPAAQKNTPSTSPSPSTTATPVPTASYAGWQTFTGTCSGFGFKYPADWSLKLTNSFIEGDCQYASVTSQAGNVLMWVPSYYGDGPGCDFSDTPPGVNDCPVETTIISESLNMPGDLKDVYLTKQILCDKAGKCEGRIALAAPTSYVPRFTVGTAQRYPLVVFGTHAMFMTQGKQTSIGNPTIPLLNFNEASARAWLDSVDVKQAELVMRSLVKN